MENRKEQPCGMYTNSTRGTEYPTVKVTECGWEREIDNEVDANISS